MKKLFILSLVLLFATIANAQSWGFGYNILTGHPEWILTNSPSNQPGNRFAIATGTDSTDVKFNTPKIRFKAVRWDATARADLKNIVSVDDSGWIYRGDIYSILDSSNVIATHAWANSRFLTSFTQVNADWNSPSGVSQVLNKPTIPSTTSQISEGSNLYYTDVRARASISGSTGITYSGTTGVITNSAPDLTVALTAGTGITVTGTYPNFTIAYLKRIETYNGSTNASGDYTVTYPVAFSAVPNVHAQLLTTVVTNIPLLTASTTTGFTIHVQNRVDVLGLLPSFPVVNGAAVSVTVFSR